MSVCLSGQGALLMSACEALIAEADWQQVLHPAVPKGATTHAPCVPPFTASLRSAPLRTRNISDAAAGARSLAVTRTRTSAGGASSRVRLRRLSFCCAFVGAKLFPTHFPIPRGFVQFFFSFLKTRQRGASVDGHPRTDNPLACLPSPM